MASTINVNETMPATNPSDFNQSSSDNSLSYTKIHQGVDFDALIENAMNASSEMIAEANAEDEAAADDHPYK